MMKQLVKFYIQPYCYQIPYCIQKDTFYWDELFYTRSICTRH